MKCFVMILASIALAVPVFAHPGGHNQSGESFLVHMMTEPYHLMYIIPVLGVVSLLLIKKINKRPIHCQ